MRSIFLLLCSTLAAFSQPFSAGVKVGLPLTDFLNTVQGDSTSVTNRYLVGPTVELHLPLGLSVEVDAIYRHFNYQVLPQGLANLTGLPSTSTAGNWEFPLLLKYKFPSHIVRPYVDGGIAWDTITGLGQSVSAVLLPGYNVVATGANAGTSGLQHNTTHGVVLGAGLDVHVLPVHVSPEIRYTRWTSEQLNLPGILHSNQNQVEFLVGVTF